MQQTPEAEAFIKRVVALPQGPGVSLDDALQPSIDDEAELRKFWATEKENSRLKDPYVGLVDVFAAPAEVRTTRARVPKDEQDLTAKYIMPLAEENRRKEGTPSMVADLDEWKKNWSIFTEGSLSQLVDWNNVVAAGGAVQACLQPLSEKEKESKRAIRKYYHSLAYPSSDVDLFLYGMDNEQAEKKIIQIYEAVRDSVPWDVTCIRTKHTVSIHSQYPYRSVQIVLRLYSSPAEVLAGFDIDAPCCLWNGERIFANPRAIIAMMRQANTVDMTRRSPSYEVRLAKYSTRGFEVYVPTLDREKVDPTIYERAIGRIEGLARLLVLEKLYDVSVRNKFIESRRTLRGRPHIWNRNNRGGKRHKGDLKFDSSVVGLEMNDYDVSTLHIPYGPGWNARRIEKLVYQTDLGMNSTFNPKNKDRRLHRHPAFFGTIEECLDDCCECCPDPIDEDERNLRKEEDESYIRGRISFIEEDPGRQTMTGSFNPIDVGEWSAQVYIGENEAFFRAIAQHDRETVKQFIARGPEEFDVNRRDHVGRTALHLALLVKAEDIAIDLVEGGAKMMWRLVDGRNALHLAAQYDMPKVIRKLMEKSKQNEEEAEKAGLIEKKDEDEKMDVDKKGGISDRPSSEDDWSSADDGVIPMDTDMSGEDEDDGEDADGEDDEGDDEDEDNDDDNSSKGEAEDATKEPEDPLAEDDEEQPDILDINMPDWDLGWTPICHAVFSGSVDAIEELVKAGADPTLLSSGRDTHVHPLTVAILREDEDAASKVAERLLLAGASSSTADSEMRTVFHHAVHKDKLKLVSTLLRCDPNAGKVLNFPSFGYCIVRFPVVTALDSKKYAMVATLLAHGAKLAFTEDDITQGMEASDSNIRSRFFQSGMISAVNSAFLPVETALANKDDIVKALIALGATYNTPTRAALQQYSSSDERLTLIDWVRKAAESVEGELSKSDTSEESAEKPGPFKAGANPSSWKSFIVEYMNETDKRNKNPNTTTTTEKPTIDRQKIARQHTLQYMNEMQELLGGLNAKTWDELNPDKPYEANTNRYYHLSNNNQDKAPEEVGYMRFSPHSYHRDVVPQSLAVLYDELFEACYTGNNDKVQQMCLPKEGSGTTPLNINACVTDHTNWNLKTGFTPLYAAVKGRQWNTAKLIIAIAVAQYKPSDKREKKFMKKIVFDDDDSDDESIGSEDTNDTAEQEEITFFDVAKKRSSVESDVHPRELINCMAWWHQWDEEEKKWSSNNTTLLVQAIEQDDFEAFVNIANLYKSCPLPVPLDGHVFDTILREDRADMLDEYIRRTGRHINLMTSKDDDENEVPGAVNDQNKLYLGLKVHGKKRADLAKADDPNTVYLGSESPLVWQAADKKARKILEWLNTDKPLAAYKYYSSTHGDELAYQLRRITDLAEKMPIYLGWTVTDLGDSPLTAAILGGDLTTVKDLFKLQPKLMSKALKTQVKFIGYNPIQLAVRHADSAALVDYLLAQGVSPAESDSVKSWNIYHQICESNHGDLLEHLLKKLPRDVNEALLCQQSKERLNTPLHIALKRGGNPGLRIIKLIAEYTKAPLLIRDVDGSTPLHKAVQAGFSEVLKILLANTPTEGLFMENGVGETVIDMATLARSFELLNGASGGMPDVTTAGRGNYSEYPLRIDISLLERELPRLKQAMEDLHTAGKLRKDSTLTKELMKYVVVMESKLKAEKKAEEERLEAVEEEEDKDRSDTQNVEETLKIVSEAITATGSGNWRKRDLVHLVDVQRSVQGNLVGHNGRSGRPTVTVVDVEGGDLGDGLGEAAEESEKDSSFVLKRVYVYSDAY